jgi:hypothetical protein
MFQKKFVLVLVILYSFVAFQSCEIQGIFGNQEINLLIIDKSPRFVDSLKVILEDFESDNNCTVIIHNLIENNQDVILDYIAKNPDSSEVIEVNSRNHEILAKSDILISQILDRPGDINGQDYKSGNKIQTISKLWLKLTYKLYVNTKALEKSGAAIKDSMPWRNFLSALDLIGRKTNFRPLGLSIFDTQYSWQLYNYCGELLNPGFADSLKALNVTEEQAVNIFVFINQLISYSSIGNNREILNSFAKGKTAAIFADELQIIDIKSINPQIEVREFKLPASSKNHDIEIFEQVNLGINKKSQNSELCQKLISFLEANSTKFGVTNKETKSTMLFAENSAMMADFFGNALYYFLFDKYYYREHYSGLMNRLEEKLRLKREY